MLSDEPREVFLDTDRYSRLDLSSQAEDPNFLFGRSKKTTGISRGETSLYSKSLKESKKNIQSTFLCPICGRMFYKKCVFDRHERKHILEKNNLGCGTAAEEGDTFVHNRVTHAKTAINGFTQDKVEPNVSRKSTPRKRGRNGFKIVSDANSDEKRFKCRVCGKGFTHSSNRSMHEKIHSDETPFTCPVCEKSFSQKRVLVRHEKIHKEGTERVECDICGRTFSQRSSYNRHRRIHAMEDEFICLICGKGFKQLRYLNEHEDRHAASMDGKVFSCQYCGRGFPRRSGYIKHMKVHKKPRTAARHVETDKKDFCRTEKDGDVSEDGAVISKSNELLTVANCLVMGDEVVAIGGNSHVIGVESIAVIDGALALGDGIITMDIDEVQTTGMGDGATALRDEMVTLENDPVTMGEEITDTENLSLLISEVEVVTTMLDDFNAIV